MRKPLELLLIITAVLAAWMVVAWFEGYRSDRILVYDKAEAHGRYQIRHYNAYNIAQVQVFGPWSLAFKEGSGILDDYLSGNNTVPASVAIEKGDSKPLSAAIAGVVPLMDEPRNNSWFVSAVIPPDYSFENLPRPNNPRVRIVHVPEQMAAIMSFVGHMDQATTDRLVSELTDLLGRDKRAILGQYRAIHYSPAWAPSFLQRHEIIIQIR